MLEYISEYEPKLAGIVSWQPHGRCFVVQDTPAFAKEVLPSFFQQRKYASFQRQLNLYGFSRITKGADRGSYYHELFLRSKQVLCRGINRMKVKGTGSRMASNPKQEPNFYLMASMPMRSSTSSGQLALLQLTHPITSQEEQIPGMIKAEDLEPNPISSSNYSMGMPNSNTTSQDDQIPSMIKAEDLEPQPLSTGTVTSCSDYGISIMPPRSMTVPKYEPSSSFSSAATVDPYFQTQMFESDHQDPNFVFDNMPFHELSGDKGAGRRHSLMDAARRLSMNKLQPQNSDTIMDDVLLHSTRRLSIKYNNDDDDDNNNNDNGPQYAYSNHLQHNPLEGQSERVAYRRSSLQMNDDEFEREMQIISRLGERELSENELGTMLDQIVDHNILF